MTKHLPNCPAVEVKARVLVVENDVRTAMLHKQNLERWGYLPIVAEGVGQALLDDAKQKSHDFACHIALLDMHLIDDYDENDKSGLDLAAILKPTLSIIVSGSGNDRATVLEALKKQAIDFVGKEEPLSRLQEALATAAQEMHCGRHGPAVDIADTLVTQIMNSLAPGKPEQVQETLKALFPKAQTITVELIGGAARTISGDLRRESYVLKVKADKLQPFAVKLASPGRIQQELGNYHDFIKHRLGHNCYAQIFETVMRWHIGGISYQFLDEGYETFMLFSKYYMQNSANDICKTVTHLFEHVWRSYITQQRPATKQSLFAGFSARWNREKWLERLDTYANKLGSLTQNDEQLGEFPDPVNWVKKRTGDFGRNVEHGEDITTKFGPLMEAVGHGDLQGDNFFVTGYRHTWVIDYERTGYGPVIQDFVLLEFDIWARLAHIENRTHFLELLCCMTEQRASALFRLKSESLKDAEVKKAFKVISKIRRLARGLISDARIYLWGVLLNAIFRIVLLDEKIRQAEQLEDYKKLFQERERAILVGAVLCRRLDDWEKTWPPVEWKLNKHKAHEQSGAASLPQNILPLVTLLLTASPTDTPALQVEEEFRVIAQALTTKGEESRFKLAYHGAVRLYELRRILLTHNPHILHFAGHGNAQGEIFVKDESGNSISMPADAFSEMLAILCKNLRCVILNACYTEPQALQIAQLVDTVIVVNFQIEDRSAIAFSKGFYEALADNRDLQTCFQSGQNEIKLNRLPGHALPQLFCTRHEPGSLYLL